MNTDKKENKNNYEKKYSQEQLDIALLKQNNSHLFKTLDRLESHQRWLLGVMASGFIGVMGLIAHGFKWII